LLSAVPLVYGLLRLVRGRHHPQHGVPLLAGETILASTALPVMAQRDRDVVREGNLWEAARSLARSCFDRVGDPWHGHAAHVPPRVVAAGWRKRLRRARQVRQLWELAYGARPLPVTPRRYAQVAALVQEVQAALADGSLRFEDHGHPPKSE
jgi:hypothetical protein